MIYKGLDDDEASFLTFVANRQADQEDQLIRQEIEEIHEFRVSECLCESVRGGEGGCVCVRGRGGEGGETSY